MLNAADTEAAKDKLNKIKQAFEDWIWTDAERAETLAKLYNERFNNLVPRSFDGSHLTIPGASSIIKFYGHQKRGIWRILSAGSTYLAHAVGAGKTFTLVAAVMEQKRLGLITKPMMTVPGHCLAQAAREFLQLYPTAKHPGGRRDQLRQGQAPALSGPRRDRELGLHHHHPFGVQVHRHPDRVRRTPDQRPACVLRRTDQTASTRRIAFRSNGSSA